MITAEEQIANLQETLDVTEALNVILKRALRQILLESDERFAIVVDISDLEIPDDRIRTCAVGCVQLAHIFLDENDELEME